VKIAQFPPPWKALSQIVERSVLHGKNVYKCHMALINVFQMFNSVFACQKQTLTVLLILALFHTCFIYFVVLAVVFCIFVLIYSAM
jgi:hypothetical protein